MSDDCALFNDIVFGPIKSRRLGLSLGVNLLPIDCKLCNFECIYCECGWRTDKASKPEFHSIEDVINNLRNRLTELRKENTSPDTITFAGNGEPTMHPQFLPIIESTIALRDELSPESKIAVLSNAALLNKADVVKALCLVDLRILKLDAGDNQLFNLINQPNSIKDITTIINHLKMFDGNLIIQSIFFEGEYNHNIINNTERKHLNSWLKAIKEINPSLVMIYTLDRPTPAKNLKKIEKVHLEQIAKEVNKLGIETIVA